LTGRWEDRSRSGAHRRAGLQPIQPDGPVVESRSRHVGRPGTGGNRPAQLTGQEASDLFAFFFAAGYFEPRVTPGAAGWCSAGSAAWHATAYRRPSARAFIRWRPGRRWRIRSRWPRNVEPLREMRQALDRGQIPYPRLSSQELTDMLVYLRGVAGPRPRAAEFSPASAETGQVLFARRGARAAIAGAFLWRVVTTRYSLTDFGAAMWNHRSRALRARPH